MGIRGNKWLVLVSAVVTQTILGGIYAWSTLTPWLSVDTARSGFIFGTTIVVFTFTMLFSGRLLVRKGPSVVASIGAVLYMAGYLLASIDSSSFILLLIAIGFVSGAGIGFGYVVPLTVASQWFPDYKGLVTGLSVGGFGGGAMLLSSVIGAVYSSGVHVDVFFRWYGVAVGLLLLVASQFLASPEGDNSLRLEKIVRKGFTRVLPLGLLGMFGGTFAGLLLIGNLTPLVLGKGFPQEVAILSVMCFSAGNSLGRIAWGHLFDRFGTVCIPLSLLLFGMFALGLLIDPPAGLLLMLVCLMGFSFGANFVLYAAAVAKSQGASEFTRIYPMIFLSYGLAGLVAPGFGGWIAETTGTYAVALIISIMIVLLVGMVLFRGLKAFELTRKSADDRNCPSMANDYA